MDIQAIEQALANAAATITSIQAHPTLPDRINPPTFAVTELEADYDQTFAGGLHVVLFKCNVFTMNSEVGKMDLNDYLAPAGAKSIKAALESDKTLGGVVKTLHVERFRGAYRFYDVGGSTYVGAEFDVRVWA